MKSGFRLRTINFNFDNSVESSNKFFEKKRVALFSVSENLDHQNTTHQLKNFESYYEIIKKLGVHEIYFCALENFINLKTKFESININKIKIIPDEKGIFNKQLGMLSYSNNVEFKYYTKNYMAII